MIYGFVCSGIEAASVAWHPLGWRPAFFSEIEAFPRAVLAERWLGVPIHGDFTTINEGDYEAIDLLVGGTPCQDFSVAGLRAGFAGDRGGLTIEFVHLARRLRPRWVVWENVPGIMSIDDGRAFGAFLSLLGKFGYGFAYRILDAQHFGVPQRRRRVFVVGYLGDWRPAAAVLFEPESLCGNPAPSREAGERVARPIASCAEGSSGWRADADTADNLTVVGALTAMDTPRGHGFADFRCNQSVDAGHLLNAATIPVQAGGDCKRGYSLNTIPLAFGGNRQSGAIDVAIAVNAHGGPHGRLDFESETFVTHSLRADGFDASEDGTGRGTPLTLAIRGRGDSHDLEYRDDGIANAILTPNGGRAGIGVGAVAFHENQRAECSLSDTAGSLKVGGGKPGQGYPALHSGMTVRRLTPRECERLQGFPDGYTAITYRGKPAADGPRYRAIGNSMAVPVVRWIGKGIKWVREIWGE